MHFYYIGQILILNYSGVGSRFESPLRHSRLRMIPPDSRKTGVLLQSHILKIYFREMNSGPSCPIRSAHLTPSVVSPRRLQRVQLLQAADKKHLSLSLCLQGGTLMTKQTAIWLQVLVKRMNPRRI